MTSYILDVFMFFIKTLKRKVSRPYGQSRDFYQGVLNTVGFTWFRRPVEYVPR